MKHSSFIKVFSLFLALLPSVAFGQSFFEREAESVRQSWQPFLPEAVLGAVFPDTGDDGMDVAEATDYRLEINLPARRLFLFHNDHVIRTYPVAVGSSRYKTPIGPRFLTNITWNPWWFPPPYSDWAKGEKPTPPGPNNPLGRVKMSLGGDIFLHGTNKEYTVGHPVSHGCMRMKNKDAMDLAWFFQEKFSDQTDEGLKEKYAQHRGDSFVVALNRKIPVAVIYELVRVGDEEVEIHPDIYGHFDDLKDQIISKLATVGIPPWAVDRGKLEELKKIPAPFSIAISDLLAESGS